MTAVEGRKALTEAEARGANDADTAAALASAREQLTATREVLEAMSASGFDLRKVLQTIAEHAVRLCRADNASVIRRDALSGYEIFASAGRFETGLEEYERYFAGRTFQPGKGSLTGRVLLARKTVQIEDMTADPDYDPASAPVMLPQTLLGVPIMHGGEVEGIIIVRRYHVATFNAREIELLETFSRQAAIAIENVRLFNETKEALEQQTATADVLKTISRSAFDLQAVFDVVVENATKLCRGDWGYLFRREGDVFRLIASHGGTAELLEYERAHPTEITDRTLMGRVALRRSTVHIPDLFEDPNYDWPANREHGVHTILGVPIFRDDEVVGAIGVARNERQPFSDADIRLVQTFADQATIAMENVRLFSETKDALAQQTALSEVLRTISRSAFDLDAVLQTIVERAAALCDADGAAIHKRVGDVTITAASFGDIGSVAGDTIPIDDRTVVGRGMLTGQRQYIPDAREHPDLPQDGPNTRLNIPFVRNGVVVGAFAVTRRVARPFSDAELRLFEVFADQAALAIENVRLFSETKESLERQTAIAAVLRVISSSPTDIAPVLRTIAESAARYCGAEDARVHLRRGDKLELMAHFGQMPATVGALIELEGTISGRAVRELRPVHQERTPDLSDQLTERTMLAAPLLREGAAIGTIVLRRAASGPFSDKQVELLQTFCDQAVIAIENVRLFNETREGLERQTALGEVLRATAASPGNIQPVLDAVAANAARLLDADDVLIARLDGAHVMMAAHVGEVPVLGAGVRDALDPGMVSHRAILEARAIHVPDLLATGDFPKATDLARQTGQRTSLAVPLLREGRPVGAILIRRTEVRPFTEPQIQLLQAFADQAAIAIENVRLFNETKESLERQTALAEILRVIASSPSDQQPVFDAIAANATRYCGAKDAVVLLVQGDALVRVAHHGPIPTPNTTPNPIVRTGVGGRAILERRTVHVADLTGPAGDEFPFARQRSAEGGGDRGILATPLLREDTAIGVILLRKLEPSGFSPSEIQLVEAFADQAVIAIENVRLFNETNEALERQTAVAQVLGRISQSAFDLSPVLETVIEHATKLCAAQQGFIYRRDGELFRLAVSYGITPEFKAFTETHPLSGTDQGTVTGRAVQGRTTVHIPDVLSDPAYTYWEAQRLGKYRALLGVPMIRDDTVIGVINLWRNEPEPFTPEQIDLVTTFANQATIAIENVRLFNETKEALARQTSISDVLQTIGRSAFDLQPVLDTVVERAVKLCDAQEGSISTLENDVYRTRASWSAGALPPEYVDFMRQEVRSPGRGSLIGRTALEGRVVQIADVLQDPEYTATEMQRAAGYRTLLGVPLLRDGRVVGVFALTRTDVRPFSDRQIELVRTFADQAAIAIENTRLFGATKEALAQQTAVGEVLKTISRSAFDLQPVLDIVLNNAVRLAGADIGWLSRVENDQFTTVAYSSEFPQAVRDELVRQRAQGHIAGPWIPLGAGGGLMGFTLAEGRTVHLPDVREDPTLRGSVVARLTESRTVVGVPMLREGRTIGGMVLARYEVRPFGEREIELVQTFADQAAIAIENVRLFDETKEALEQQRAISDVLKTISGTVFELEPTLQTVVENAAKLADADLAWMTQRSDRDTFTWGARYARTAELALAYGDLSKLRLELVASGPRQGLMSRLYTERRTIALSDVEADPDLLDKSRVAKAVGARSVVGVPVLSEGDVLGAIVLARREVRPFSEREVHVVETFADQAAIAIRNVRLFNEIQDKSRQLEIASRHKSEFLANMSHELRTPLNAIIGFSEVLIQGLFGEVNEKQREYLQDVVGSGQHLLSLINDILDLSKIEAGRMELELSTFSLRDALESGLTIVRERANRHNIAINAIVSDELGQLEADERKVKQIFYNLLSNAVKFTADGGRVDVIARRENGDARVEVRDSGIGIAPEDQARIFEEFQQVGRERSREGTGLGLTLTKRFVELHGGRIWLQSTPGKGSTFTFTLPLRQPGPVPA